MGQHAFWILLMAGTPAARRNRREVEHHISSHPCKLITNAFWPPSLIAESTADKAAMASGRDVRDMLGLPMGGDAPKAAMQKRPKPSGATKKMPGVAREVAALYGERPPPVAVYEESKAYRAKRQNTGPAKKWEQQPFLNPVRSDGLVLKHWRRKPAPAPPVQAPEDATMQDSDSQDALIELCSEYAKYNIEVDLPTFTDDEYVAYLSSDDWSREETDYLFQMVSDYAYRWAVIWDRYDFKPTNNGQQATENANGERDQALATMPFAPSKQRTVEDLKARFYGISATLMKQRIPEVQMDAEQYSTYEMLSKFDPMMERTRKGLATALMNRSMDEVKEEEFLLTELQRINMAANRLDAEREELRARLDAPQPNQAVSAGLQSFTSSQALQALFQQLFQQDRSKKRATNSGTGPGRLSLSANDMVHTPGSAQAQLSAANRRQSMASQPVAQTPVKHLSPHQENRFNVSTHDRLTSGVTFGSDKLLKMRQAKSNVQTQKIGAALAELGIADVIPIPTSKVGEVFESLVTKLGKLLDVRKVREKEEGECRVLQKMKEGGRGNSQARGEGMSATPKPKSEVQDTPDVDADGDNDDEDDDDDNPNYGDDDGQGDNEDDAEGDEDDDGENNLDDLDAEGEDESSVQQSRATSQSAGGHKRSASVFSQNSQQSIKRARK
ncbi:swr complex subunit [Pleosporales sp. CAS-2024a]